MGDANKKIQPRTLDMCVWVRGGTTRSGFIDPTAPAAIPPAQDGRARTQEGREKDEGEGKSGRDVSLRCGLEGMDTSLVRIYSLDGQMFTWPTDG